MFNPLFRHPAARLITAGTLVVLIVTLASNASAISTTDSRGTSLRWDNQTFTTGTALVSHLSAKGVDAETFLRSHPAAARELGLNAITWDGMSFFTMAGIQRWSRRTGTNLTLWLQRHPGAGAVLRRNADQGPQVLAMRLCGFSRCSVPRATLLPTASGSAALGQAVTVSSGIWVGAKPLSFAYRWQRCTSSSTCSDIGGETGQTYTVRAADVSATLRALVRVSNRFGQSTATSGLLGPVPLDPTTSAGGRDASSAAPTSPPAAGTPSVTRAVGTPASAPAAAGTPSPQRTPISTPAPASATAPASPSAGTSTPAPRTSKQFGIATGALIEWRNDADLARELDGYRQIGATWIRFDIKWSVVEEKKGVFNWTIYDRLIGELRKRGISIIANLAYTPTWARPPGATDDHYPPVNVADYANFARAAAARYGPQGVSEYEIWNEPNLSGFWRPAPDAAKYTAMLKAAYAAIKSVNTPTDVLAGAFAPAGGYNDPTCGQGSSIDINGLNFLETMYANGAKGNFDGLSTHPYTGSASPTGTHRCSAWYQMFGTSPSLRSLLLSNGDGGKKIWGTEFGTDLAWVGGSEARQASQLEEAMDTWRGYDWAAGFMVYAYRQNLEGFNLVRPDWTPRPVWYSFQAGAK